MNSCCAAGFRSFLQLVSRWGFRILHTSSVRVAAAPSPSLSLLSCRSHTDTPLWYTHTQTHTLSAAPLGNCVRKSPEVRQSRVPVTNRGVVKHRQRGCFWELHGCVLCLTPRRTRRINSCLSLLSMNDDRRPRMHCVKLKL